MRQLGFGEEVSVCVRGKGWGAGTVYMFVNGCICVSKNLCACECVYIVYKCGVCIIYVHTSRIFVNIGCFICSMHVNGTFCVNTFCLVSCT